MFHMLRETLPKGRCSSPATAMAPNLHKHCGQSSTHLSYRHIYHATTCCGPVARKQVHVEQNLVHVVHQVTLGEVVETIHQGLRQRRRKQTPSAQGGCLTLGSERIQRDTPQCRALLPVREKRATRDRPRGGSFFDLPCTTAMRGTFREAAPASSTNTRQPSHWKCRN